MEIEIKGHSGCQVEIVNKGGNLYISKSTHNKDYIPRLYRQAVKQQMASRAVYQHIRIPEIYEIERTEEYVNVKMEYVYSKNYIDYFEDAGFDQINYFIKALKIFIDWEIEHSSLEIIDRQVILDKFRDVCCKIQRNDFINKDKEVMEIMECEILPDGNRNYRTLYHYNIVENRLEGDRFIIHGEHERVQGISESLKKRFLENGMPKEQLVRWEGEEA